MTRSAKLLRAILEILKSRRERDAGLLEGLDRRTLQDIGMVHYGITSFLFREEADVGKSAERTDIKH